MQVIRTKDLNDSQLKNLQKMKDKGMNKEQLKEYALALYFDIDLDLLSDPKMDAKKMREIRLGLQEGLNVYLYNEFDTDKMYEIRYGLECSRMDKRDIRKYLNYSADQIKFINDMYNQGFTANHIALFDDIKYSTVIMENLKELVRIGAVTKPEEIPTNPMATEDENFTLIEEFVEKKFSSSEEVVVEEKEEKTTITATQEEDNIFGDDMFFFDEDDEDSDIFSF